MARFKETEEDKKWQAQDDLRTLERAAEITKDKARLDKAQAEAKRQMEALVRVAKQVKGTSTKKRQITPRRKPRTGTRAKTRKR